MNQFVVHYQVNGKISYIEVGSDIIEVRGNEVYLNGELIATITSTVISGDPSVIEPYTGWLYTDECSFGTPSDYTRYIKTVEHNITFEEAIEELSGDIILTILVSAVNSFATDQPVRHSDLIFLQESLKIFITGHTTTLNEQKFMHLNISMDIKTGWAIYIKTNTSIMVTGLIHKKSVPKPCSLSGLSFSSSLLLFII